MDITSVSLGKAVRDDLKDYRDNREYPNYNEAIAGLLEEVSDERAVEISN